MHIFNTWITTTNSFRQWPPICLRPVCTVLKQNGIKHFKNSPCHPSCNGLTERFIQTLKKALKASKDDTTLQQHLASFLLSYQTSPHATTEEMSCALLMGRSLHTRLDLLKPDHETQVHNQ